MDEKEKYEIISEDLQATVCDEKSETGISLVVEESLEVEKKSADIESTSEGSKTDLSVDQEEVDKCESYESLDDENEFNFCKGESIPLAHVSRMINNKSKDMQTIYDIPKQLLDQYPKTIISKNEGFLKKQLTYGVSDEFPIEGQIVYITYTGYYCLSHMQELVQFTHLNNKKFLQLGNCELLSGIDEALISMNCNETALFYLPSQTVLGPGIKELDIMPMKHVVFEITLNDIGLIDVSPKKDKSIMKRILQAGQSIMPNDGALVSICMIKSKEELTTKQDVTYELGEGIYNNVPEEVDYALRRFKANEKSFLYFPAKNFADSTANQQEIEKYQITLKSFERAKEVWQLNTDQKLEIALILKEKGIKACNFGFYRLALRNFKKIVSFLEDEPGADPATVNERNDCLVFAYVKIALCSRYLGHHRKGIEACDKALVKDPDNEFAHYERGQCLIQIKEFEPAYAEFMKAHELNGDNIFYKNLANFCCMEAKKQKEKEKAVYDNMFGKFAERDEAKRKQRDTETGTWSVKMEARGDSKAGAKGTQHSQLSQLLEFDSDEEIQLLASKDPSPKQDERSQK